jgi:hypothetical protein
MESTLKILSLNYISNTILNNNDSKRLLINNINEEDMLKVINEITSHYLFNKEQVLIISNTEKSKILNEEIFKSLGKRLIDFQDNYDLSDRIKKILLDLQDQTGKTTISKIELINRDIKKKYEILGQINKLFLNKNINDSSLIEKYETTERRINNFDSYYKYYKTFRIKKPLNIYSYSDVKESCENIINSDYSSYYVKYRRFIDNDIFKCLKHPINYDILYKSISKIKHLIKNKTINYNLMYSKYTSDFIDVFFLNDTMDKNYIMSLSNIINLKYNNSILKTDRKKEWFKIFKKKKKLLEEDNLNLFSNFQKEIYNEYINNYNSICMLKDKLSFLIEILSDGTYIETLRNIVRGEDVYETLEYYLKIFEIAYKSKKNIEVINDISSIELDILNYCYEDLEEKKEINSLISTIPKLKLYLDIEEEETKYTNIIKIYNEYDKMLDSIINSINKRNSLLYNAINNVWDNQLREASSLLMENINYISMESLNRFFPCIISNNSIDILESLIDKKFYFKKIIVLTDDYCSTTNNILNGLGENIIILSKTNNSNINNFKIIDTIKLYNSYKTDNNENILVTEINNYLKNKMLSIGTNIDDNHLEQLKIEPKKKIAVIVSPSSKKFDYNNIITDIYISYYYKENNVNTYRVWYRDWWIDKYGELTKLEKYIKEIESN